MPRPEKERSVKHPPLFYDFKPTGIPRRFISVIEFSLDEFEAVRLTDYLGLDHDGASLEMNISRPTFTRIYDKARKKIARFLTEGMNLRIEGGSVHFKENIMRCKNCNKAFPSAIGTQQNVCPFCGSSDLTDLAHHYGHGPCCCEEPVDG
jgi:uncharacterized protein